MIPSALQSAKSMKPFLLLLACIFPATGPVHAQTKIACIGNSITYGYGLSYGQDYPSRLQALLGTSAYTVQNDGVNSTTMLKRGNLPYWTNGKLPQVFSFKPAIVTIKLGTNDTKPENWGAHSQEFKTDYLAMVDTLAAMSSKPRIFLVLPVPVFSNPTATSWGIRDSIIKLEMPIIKQVAAERNLTVIDCNTPLLKFPQYFSVDGVHPNAAGADTIAHIVYRALMAATSVADVKETATRPVFAMARKGNDLLSLTISSNGSSAAEIYDIEGKRVGMDKIAGPGTCLIKVDNLKSGIYVVRLRNGLSRQSYYQRADIVKP